MRNPALAAAIASSTMAATAWFQLATRTRMPGTASNSSVPARAANTPKAKAAPADQVPTATQNGSAVYQ